MKKIQSLVFAIVAIFSTIQVKAQQISANQAVLTAYFQVKNALIAGDQVAAEKEAAQLLNALTSFPVKDMKPGDKAAWSKYSEKLKFDARHISESSEITHQRNHFVVLSENMFSVVKALKLSTATIYRAYCPMKKAYWLSDSSAIKNPYYGEQMLTCGEVKETISAKK